MAISHAAAVDAGSADVTPAMTTFNLPFNEYVDGAAWTATSGRVLYLMCAADKSVGTWTDPSGWTAINKRVGTDVSLAVWYRVADGTETTVTLAWSTNVRMAGAYVMERDDTTINGLVSASANSGTTDVDSIASGSADAGRPAIAIAVVALDSTTAWGGISGQPTWSDSYTRVGGHNDTGTPSSNSGFPGWSVATKSVSASTSVTPSWSPNFDQAAITLAVFPLRLAPPPVPQLRLPQSILAR